MVNRGRKGLGQILLTKGWITEEHLGEALATQKKTGERLGKVLADLGFATQEQVTMAVAEQRGIASVDLASYKIDRGAADLVSQQLARQHNLIPVARGEDGSLVVAMADPTDLTALDDVSRETGLRVKPVAASLAGIHDALNRTYGLLDSEDFTSALQQVGREREEATVEDGAEFGYGGSGAIQDLSDAVAQEISVDAAPIVKMCNLLIKQAIRESASDIHVEPGRRRVRVRYRIDGVLHEVMQLPKYVQPPLISRIKILSDMNIAEKRLPQDGRIHIRQDRREFDLRVSVIPTINGEKAVMRILDQTSILIGLDKLGFLPDTQAMLEELIVQPNGMLLSTGPTGHGKTTSQYSMLHKINSVDKNIITIEDPVEYQLPNISQVHVNRRAGLTFANALRYFMRQDPDIIMVGEIRDLETAEIAIQASLTGHLVLSTLHTNDAPSATTRLTDMGVEPFLISATVIAVLAQRLGRRICSECKIPYEPSRELLHRYGYNPEEHGDGVTFYKGAGCELCRHTGYRGRTGIFELMVMNPEIAELVVRRAPLADVREAARAAGMRTLREDGFQKCQAGWTTPEEVARVVFTAGAEF